MNVLIKSAFVFNFLASAASFGFELGSTGVWSHGWFMAMCGWSIAAIMLFNNE